MNTALPGTGDREPAACDCLGLSPSGVLSRVGPYCCAHGARLAFDVGFGPLSASRWRPTLAGIRLAGALAVREVDVSAWEQTLVPQFAAAADVALVQAAAGWLRRARDPYSPDRHQPFAGPYRTASEARYVFDCRASALPVAADRGRLSVVWLGAALATHRVRLTPWEASQVSHLGSTAPIDTVQAFIGLVIRASRGPGPAAEVAGLPRVLPVADRATPAPAQMRSELP